MCYHLSAFLIEHVDKGFLDILHTCCAYTTDWVLLSRLLLGERLDLLRFKEEDAATGRLVMGGIQSSRIGG